jgi:hypothetical protein
MSQSKILLGFLTAHHPSRWHYRQILREQCLKDSPIPYKFVFGDPVHSDDWNNTGLDADEILHASGSDLKTHMHLKDQELFRYALSHDFAFCYRCCDDSWVFPDRILKAGLEAYDLAGNFPCRLRLGGTYSVPFAFWNYCHGGVGIWLSRKAMEMIVATPWDEHHLDDWPNELDIGFGLTLPKPIWYWEDHFLGEVLQGNLAWNDPLRRDPWAAYIAQGLNVLADEQLFVNDDPMRALSIHDPGRVKINDSRFDDLMKQIKRRNVVSAGAGREADREAERAVVVESRVQEAYPDGL